MTLTWPVVKLGEVLAQDKRFIDAPEPRIYQKLSVRLYGKGAVLDAPVHGSTLKMHRHQLARAGQVILSEIWGKKGAIGLVPIEGEGALCTSHFFLFNVCSSRVESKWLAAIFRANFLENQLGSEARGTTGYAAVRPKNLLAAEIPLPPLEQQRRLVATLDALSTKVAAAGRLCARAAGQANVLTASYVLERFRCREPGAWPTRTLGDYVADCCYGTSQKSSDDDSGTPVLRMGNIQAGHLDLQDLKYLHLSDRERARLLLIDGDILVNRTNSAELVGKCAVFGAEGEWSFASDLIRLRLDRARRSLGWLPHTSIRPAVAPTW